MGEPQRKFGTPPFWQPSLFQPMTQSGISLPVPPSDSLPVLPSAAATELSLLLTSACNTVASISSRPQPASGPLQWIVIPLTPLIQHPGPTARTERASQGGMKDERQGTPSVEVVIFTSGTQTGHCSLKSTVPG